MLRNIVLLGILLLPQARALADSSPPPPSPLEIQQPPQTKPGSANNGSNSDQRGTDKSPLIVKVIPPPKTAEESANDEQDRQEKAASDYWVIKLTGALALIGALQLLVFGYQAWQLRRTVRSMEGQSEDMKAYITEAARAADAMESVSVSLGINAAKIVEVVEMNKAAYAKQADLWLRQTRAYVSVLIGSGVYQENSKGLRFEAKPVIRNSGNTPAYGVRHRSRAAVLPIPPPQDFRFTLPREWAGRSIVGPHSHVEISAIVPNQITDAEIVDVKKGNGKILYAWGVVSYRDISKRIRRITFAQRILWVGEPGKEVIRGFYLDRHNRSN